MASSSDHPLRVAWRLWRDRHENPLAWGGVVLPFGGERRTRLANRVAWIGPWVGLGGAILLTAALMPGGSALRNAASGIGEFCALFGPVVALLVVPLVVLGFVGMKRDKERLGELQASGMSRDEVVFGTFLPAGRAVFALHLPFVLAGVAATIDAARGSPGWEGHAAETIAMASVFPVTVAWAFLASVGMALRLQRVSRLHLLLPGLETVALLGGVLAFAAAVREIGIVVPGMVSPPWAGPLAAWLGGILIVTAGLGRAASRHAGLRFFRALDPGALQDRVLDEVEETKPWHVRAWVAVARRSFRAAFTPDGGRATFLAGQLAGVMVLLIAWGVAAAAWPLLFKGVWAMPYRLRLRDTVMLSPLPCLAAALAAVYVTTVLALLRGKGRLGVPVSELRLAVAFGAIPHWVMFAALGLVSVGVWNWRESSRDWWLAVGAYGVGAIVILLVSALLRIAVAWGKWASVAAFVTLLVLVVASGPSGLLYLPVSATGRAPHWNAFWSEARAAACTYGALLLLLSMLTMGCGQRLYEQECGMTHRRGGSWRWLAGAVVVAWAVWAVPPRAAFRLQNGSRDALYRSVDESARLRVKFLDGDSNRPAEGVGSVNTGSDLLTGHRGGEPQVEVWEKKHVREMLGHQWPPVPLHRIPPGSRRTVPLAFARPGFPPVDCGSITMELNDAEEFHMVRVPPPATRRIRLLDEDGSPIPGAELQAWGEGFRGRRFFFWDRELGPIEPVACLVTDDAGVAVLPPAATEIQAPPGLLISASCDGPFGEYATAGLIPDGEPTDVYARRDTVQVHIRLVGSPIAGEVDAGTVRVTTVAGPGPTLGGNTIAMEERATSDGRITLGADPGGMLSFARVHRTPGGGFLLSPESVAIGRNGRDQFVDISEANDCILEGRARGRDGQPANGVTVFAVSQYSFSQPTGRAIGISLSDNRGYFHLPLVRGREYLVLGYDSGLTPERILVEPMRAAWEAKYADFLWVSRGYEVSRPYLLQPSPRNDSCDIVVIDQDDEPVRGAWATSAIDRPPFESSQSWVGSVVRTDEFGRANLRTGHYTNDLGSIRLRTLVAGLPDPTPAATKVLSWNEPVPFRAWDARGRMGFGIIPLRERSVTYIRIEDPISVCVVPHSGHEVGRLELVYWNLDWPRFFSDAGDFPASLSEEDFANAGITVERLADGSAAVTGPIRGWTLEIHGTNGIDKTEFFDIKESGELQFPKAEK